MKFTKSEIVDFIHEEMQKVINEKYDTPGVGEDGGMSVPAYERKLNQLGISDSDVDRIESGSSIGYRAPGGYVFYLNTPVIGKNELKKMAEAPVLTLGVDRKTGNLKISTS